MNWITQMIVLILNVMKIETNWFTKDFSEDALAHEKYQYLGLISKTKHI
jgi:hypothetical protein